MRSKLILLVLVNVMLAGVTQAESLAPNDSSIQDNLSVWLRNPLLNLDEETGIWSDVSGNENHAMPVGPGADNFTFVGPSLDSGSNTRVFDKETFSTAYFAGNVPDLLQATHMNGGEVMSRLTIFTVYSIYDIQHAGGDATRPAGIGALMAGDGASVFNLSADMTIRMDNGNVGGATVGHPDEQFFIRVARMSDTGINQWVNTNGSLEKVQNASGRSYTTSNDSFYLGDIRGTIGSGHATETEVEIAEAIVYNAALTDEQVEGISQWLQAKVGKGLNAGVASNPSPADGVDDVLQDSILSWDPGETAATYTLYVGANFEDVNAASVSDPLGTQLFEGYTDTTLDLGLLTFGQTYFWRVDAVNAAPDGTVFPGPVWRFGVEPEAMAVVPVAVTSSSVNSDDMGPEKTIDGSGLNAMDQHSTIAEDMWLTAPGDTEPWIQFELDRLQKLHEMWVWNSNQSIENIIGVSVKDVSIETSVDGTTWTALGEVTEFAQATGSEDYTYNTVVDFGGVAAKFIKLNIHSRWGGLAQYGLSEVRLLVFPVYPREPQPADGATNVATDIILSWRAGRDAVTHKVYGGTDPNALELLDETSENSLAVSVDLDQTYNWRVDEINAADPTTWSGDTWHYATVAFNVIDDMESYRDAEFEEIWATWNDGYNDSTNGATVGTAPLSGDYTPEKGMVRSGSQSLPIWYDNTTAAKSEVTRTFAEAKDFTANGARALVLYFQGKGSNTAGRLYVKIDDVEIEYSGDADNLRRLKWQKWVIPTAGMTQVESMTIGIDKGGKGTLYVDDIILVPSLAGETITPVEPSTDGLVVHYPFDGDYRDASGNGRHGDPVGNPNFEASSMGQALALDGAGDYMVIPGYKGVMTVDGVQQAFSIALWFKSTVTGNATLVSGGTNANYQRLSFRFDGGRLRTEYGGGFMRGLTIVNDGEWHHGALTVVEGAHLVAPDTLIYVDGQQEATTPGRDLPFLLTPEEETDVNIGQKVHTNNRFYFDGSLDDFKYYNRALRAEEVAGLAGRVHPFAK